ALDVLLPRSDRVDRLRALSLQHDRTNIASIRERPHLAEPTETLEDVRSGVPRCPRLLLAQLVEDQPRCRLTAHVLRSTELIVGTVTAEDALLAVRIHHLRSS